MVNAGLDCIFLFMQYKSGFGIVGVLIGTRNINEQNSQQRDALM